MSQGNNGKMPTPEMQLYFQSLPTFVQESLKQTSISPKTMEELKSCADNLLAGK